jgi:phage terminase small subunit
LAASVKNNKGLTVKQEAFAVCVFKGMSQAQAYREAYDAENSSDGTIYKRASELMANGAVAGRVQELKNEAAKAAKITIVEHLQDLKALRNAAASSANFGAAITAEVARGRVCGLYVERLEHTGKDGEPIETKHIVDVDGARAALAEALAKAGLTTATTENPE